MKTYIQKRRGEPAIFKTKGEAAAEVSRLTETSSAVVWECCGNWVVLEVGHTTPFTEENSNYKSIFFTGSFYSKLAVSVILTGADCSSSRESDIEAYVLKRFGPANRRSAITPNGYRRYSYPGWLTLWRAINTRGRLSVRRVKKLCRCINEKLRFSGLPVIGLDACWSRDTFIQHLHKLSSLLGRAAGRFYDEAFEEVAGLIFYAQKKAEKGIKSGGIMGRKTGEKLPCFARYKCPNEEKNFKS